MWRKNSNFERPGDPATVNPYCAFRDDVERRKALISRDIRLVLCCIVTAICAVWLAHSGGEWAAGRLLWRLALSLL